jgi:hypothetical protein
MLMVPESNFKLPERHRNRVVFPEPLGPSRHRISPAPTSRLMSSRIVRSPYRAGDAAGLAEAWLKIGQQLFYLADSPADQEALERAAGYARRSGNQRALAEISKWRVVTSEVLPFSADVALQKAEELLREAAGDPRAEANILQDIPPLYAYVGRLGDALAAATRSQKLHVRSGAKFDWALVAIFGGAEVEMAVGNPAAAEKHLADRICRPARHLRGPRTVNLRAASDSSLRSARSA